ncbi:MAG: type II and III secretion system protein [Pirellulales bacterium]|nr:type II and III secretion system protein [Pirellulales bacterium]
MLNRASRHHDQRLAGHLPGLLVLLFAVSGMPLHARAQDSSLFEKLGSSLSTISKSDSNVEAEALPAPQSPQQHVIPFAQPEEKGDIKLEEDEGMISLMVRDAPLRQVIALVAETQKLNIVFAAPADIDITASFERLPWQRVLDSLLTASGHTWTNDNGIVLVTSMADAENAPPGAGGRHIEVFELDFASALDVDQAIKGLLSPAGNSWVTEGSSGDNRRTREIVAVVDYPAHLAQIAEYICQVDQPPRQVLIEAHILQIDLDEECRNGFDYEQITSFRGNRIRFFSEGLANAAAPTASFLEVDGAGLNSLLELLQTTTDAKTLASPRVLAVSGQEARIQIGDQLGYRITTTTQTSSLESVEFLDVGVVLTVTPRITRDGRVLMRIKPEVSNGQIDPNTGLPAEETTEVETDILLNSGQGMVIGGLIQETDSIIQSKVPWLGDLPYLGLLFQRRTQAKVRSEIVVTLLPHVQPYTPIVAQREQFEFQRAHDPLTTGPLDIYPRPYEAKLPDAIRNPRRPLLSLKARREGCSTNCQLAPLPAVKEQREIIMFQPDSESE